MSIFTQEIWKNRCQLLLVKSIGQQIENKIDMYFVFIVYFPCTFRDAFEVEVMGSNYKRLLQQRNVLDTLRIYLDVTEDFLERLRKAKILTADEHLIVKVGRAFQTF